MRVIDPGAARRIALRAQGIGDRPTAYPDIRHFRKAAAHLRLVQLDSVNVIDRSHRLVFFSRLGPYDVNRLDDFLWRTGSFFEYWGHEASLLPVDDWPLMVHRMQSAKPWKGLAEVVEEHPDYVDAILAEVEARGPLTAGDLEDPGSRAGPWWGWNRGKLVLEWHFMVGAVTVADRVNFARYYDLSHRVIPPEFHSAPALSRPDARRELLLRSVRAHGIGTVADVADYYRIKPTDAKPLLAELAEGGMIEEVEVPGWPGPVYMDPAATIPRRIHGRTLLSPFDPVVWFRDRAERLFDFHYRIEIYTPKPKRVYGYYVLPFLLGDRLVGRVDLKNDRQAGVLRVHGAFAEPGVDRIHVGTELAAELRDMAEWLGARDIEVAPNGDLASPVVSAL